MSKHTPGPWKYRGFCIVTGDICIAVIENDGGYHAPADQRDANGKLLAAAPDLLESLKAIVALIRDFQAPECDDKGEIGAAELQAADTAIARAEGVRP